MKIDMNKYEDREKYDPFRFKEWPRHDEHWPRIQERKELLDPLTVDIIEGALEWAIDEGEAVVERMARGSIIREQHDYRASFNTVDCNSVTHVSWAATADPIRNCYELEDIRPGDVFVYNDVYSSLGTIGHLPDYCAVVPVFSDERIIGFSQIFGHCTDVGGRVVGSWPLSSTSIFEDGTMCPPIKLYDQGKLNEEAYRIILRNSRFPDELRGDIDAFISCARLIQRQVLELCQRYDTDTVEAAFYEIMDRCEKTVIEKALPQIPEGEFIGEDFIENDGVDRDKPVKIKLTILKDSERMIVDFEGTDPQTKGPINWPMDGRHFSKWLGAFIKGYAPGMVINDGFTKVFQCMLPPKTVLSARFPAPSSDRMTSMLMMINAFTAAMVKATKGNAVAAMQNIQLYAIFGENEKGEPFLYREIFGAGSGARPYEDGTDMVDLVPNSRNLPAEFIEQRYPVIVERVGAYIDSGGPGKHRGGLGYLKDVRALVDGYFSPVAYRTEFACFGVNGGMAGKPGVCWINPGTPQEKKIIHSHESIPIKAGDIVRITTPGGGGWGDPLERDPERVRLDVQRNIVSLESAKDDYGVILQKVENPRRAYEIDESATKQLRDEIRKNREPLKLINRGERVNQLINEGKISVSDYDMLAFPNTPAYA
ncbi:hydantoinase B/oxoprolinase family protein [Peribacillus cavernae]|uniref:Hydantoinase B/oxoprolinase family protein n=1 Tax=Peribacillus cavernae TaxID=1674310 RepID=A0A433HFN5_9BACI|nr:hydantoinase B/oxoprolinase family protein [Peribacillus cavernae]MDQ0219486.1 N-methylhydantoinase B [Peribacillus cavernae]RUQ27095.1 hydantoinase B/oxoprolinase family protein [Peribacillus cavernae]